MFFSDTRKSILSTSRKCNKLENYADHFMSHIKSCLKICVYTFVINSSQFWIAEWYIIWINHKINLVYFDDLRTFFPISSFVNLNSTFILISEFYAFPINYVQLYTTENEIQQLHGIKWMHNKCQYLLLETYMNFYMIHKLIIKFHAFFIQKYCDTLTTILLRSKSLQHHLLDNNGQNKINLTVICFH